MKRIGTLLALVAFVALSALAVAAPQKPKTFSAHLSGKQEVPAVDTKGQGQLNMQLSKDGTKLHFRLNAANLKKITAAHLHLGAKGFNGEPVALLFGGPTTSVQARALLAKGTLTDASLIGPLAGMTIKDLVAKIKAGEIYVNVHTEAFPTGAIRGQVKANPPPAAH